MHIQTFSLATPTTIGCLSSRDYSRRLSQCLSNTLFLLLPQEAHHTDKLNGRTSVQTAPSSAQDLQRAVQFDTILLAWLEPAFLVQEGSQRHQGSSLDTNIW